MTYSSQSSPSFGLDHRESQSATPSSHNNHEEEAEEGESLTSLRSSPSSSKARTTGTNTPKPSSFSSHLEPPKYSSSSLTPTPSIPLKQTPTTHKFDTSITFNNLFFTFTREWPNITSEGHAGRIAEPIDPAQPWPNLFLRSKLAEACKVDISMIPTIPKDTPRYPPWCYPRRVAKTGWDAHPMPSGQTNDIQIEKTQGVFIMNRRQTKNRQFNSTSVEHALSSLKGLSRVKGLNKSKIPNAEMEGGEMDQSLDLEVDLSTEELDPSWEPNPLLGESDPDEGWNTEVDSDSEVGG